MLLVVSLDMVLVLLVVALDNNKESNAGEDESLAKSLRRQLMINNYDYSLEENNTTEKEISNTRRKAKKTRRNFYVSDLVIEENEDGKINNNNSKFNDSEKNDTTNIETVKLLYDNKDDIVNTEKSNKIEPTVRYKLLKVRRQYRRNGQARLIQEENKEGIAIVNLDKGPFPEIRLSNSRRQYMHDHGEVITDDEEVPPPAVNTSDPEAAPDEIENLTGTELAISTTNKFGSSNFV